MTTKTLPEVPVGMQRIYRRFERWRKSHRGRLPIPEALWAAAAELAREHGVFRTAKTLRLEHSKLKGMVKVKSTKPAVRRAPTPPGGGLLGVGGTAALCARSDGVRHRVGRAARQDAHPVERGHGAGSRRTEPVIVGVGVIQIAPQMRILVAIEPVDGRKGIDSLARLCQEKLRADPFSGCLFVFRSRRGTSIRILVYDGQGFWLAQKRLSQGRFVWWPSGKEPSRVLQAHQAQLLLAAGNPETEAAPVWRKVS